MNQLKISQLCRGFVIICENAAELIEDARILLERDRYSRSYVMSYTACEEIGKLPVLVGAATMLIQRRKVNWKSVTTQFRDHSVKSFQFLGLGAGAVMEKRFNLGEKFTKEDFVDAMISAQSDKGKMFNKRNSFMYTEELSGKFLKPSAVCTKIDAMAILELAKLLYESQMKFWGTTPEEIEATLIKGSGVEAQKLALEMVDLALSRRAEAGKDNTKL